MTSVLSSHPQKLPYVRILENSTRVGSRKLPCLGCSSSGFHSRRTASGKGRRLLMSLHERATFSRPIFVSRAVGDHAESSDSADEDQEKGGEKDEVNFGLSRDDLERIVGADDAKFSGIDLANLIREKYGRSYDVQLIKKEFMGRNLLAMNVMWKYREQRSFPLTEEEYLLRLDGVANTLRCWGAVSHVRNSLAKLKERPRIGKAVSIFIDMDESGGRSREWIYK